MIAALIARNTFREATRDRVLAGMTVAGIVLLLLVQILTPLAMGQATRLVVDLGLSSISMLGLLVVLMVGTSLVAKEIERRTIFSLLSRPIPRSSYLIGKWAGLTGSVWTIAAVLGIALWTVMALRGSASFGASIAQATYLAALELAVITAVAVMFSALSTPVLSALYTLGVYLVGQWCNDLRSLAAQFPPTLARVTEVLANVAPNLPLFNMRALAADGTPTSALHLGVATLYALFYCTCVLALATAAFESRDFK
jgi:ABC-type transport system involved in multi-copper enzyme maturation permease subunit